MLLMSAGDEAELDVWRSKYGGCLMPKGQGRRQPPLAEAINRLPRTAALFIQARLRAGGWLGPVCLEAAEVAEIESSSSLPRYQLMSLLLEVGAALAQGVGPNDPGNITAVAESRSGGLYVGAPVMWKGNGVKFAVHGVQAAVISAWHHGEIDVKRIMTDAPPCVCCRQFLREISTWNNLGLMVAPAGDVALMNGALQELPLGLEGLRLEGIKARFMNEPKRAIGLGKSAGTGEIVNIAAEGAALSYAPYSKNYAGVALRTRRGTLHRGRYAETAATIAGLTAIEGAFTDLALCGGLFADVEEVLLIETRGTVTQFSSTQRLTLAMGNINFRFVMAT